MTPVGFPTTETSIKNGPLHPLRVHYVVHRLTGAPTQTPPRFLQRLFVREVELMPHAAFPPEHTSVSGQRRYGGLFDASTRFPGLYHRGVFIGHWCICVYLDNAIDDWPPADPSLPGKLNISQLIDTGQRSRRGTDPQCISPPVHVSMRPRRRTRAV